MPALAEIAGCMCMQLRSIFGLCFIYISHWHKRLVFYLYCFLGLLKYVWRFRNNKANRVSDHPCRITFSYKYIPVLLYMAYLVDRHIRCCQNAEHAGQRLRFFLVYLFYYCPRVIGSDR